MRKDRYQEIRGFGEDRDPEQDEPRFPGSSDTGELGAPVAPEKETDGAEEHDEVEHALVEDVIRHEGQLVPKLQQRSDRVDREAQDAIGPVDHSDGGKDEDPAFPALGPEGEGELVDESRDRPNQGEGREGPVFGAIGNGGGGHGVGGDGSARPRFRASGGTKCSMGTTILARDEVMGDFLDVNASRLGAVVVDE